ncbi:LysR family transcriptional regulator [uncultured Dysosmobacter sp.]|uniref:LysR family transcriptional regulator n=1 Tax=uncultured Dysosmobacter sp. TaxID=2591384 RepID=UPI00261D97AC|nr:LysR family transcriptional regulator [uncultured Dysosmobacter sp.]
MDLKNLKTFIYVAELSSFTKASQRLGFSQSTISFQIKQLEEELNVRLFERIHHTVNLTEQGRDVLRYAHQMDKLMQELANDLREEKEITGHIRLAMADSLCGLFGETFQDFWLDHPGISLKIITAGTDEMFRLLNHNEVDLVFTLDNHIYNTEYVIIREEKIEAHFVAAPDHPLARQKHISLPEIVQAPFLLTEKGMSYRRLMDEQLATRSLEIHPILEAGSTELICRLVEQGAGCSFLPDYATASAVAAGRLVYLAVDGFKIDVWKQLFCHRDKWISPQMQSVIQHCAGI